MGVHPDLIAPAMIRPAAVDRARVVLAVALIALAPDGDATQAQLARLRVVLAGAPLLVDVAPFALSELIPRTLQALARRGPDQVLADLRGLILPGLAETALALAVRAALCDGRIPAETAGILGGLADRLGVQVDVFADMLAVLRMLERPAA